MELHADGRAPETPPGLLPCFYRPGLVPFALLLWLLFPGSRALEGADSLEGFADYVG